MIVQRSRPTVRRPISSFLRAGQDQQANDLAEGAGVTSGTPNLHKLVVSEYPVASLLYTRSREAGHRVGCKDVPRHTPPKEAVGVGEDAVRHDAGAAVTYAV